MGRQKKPVSPVIRQQTLGKFLNMPSTVKSPPQQSSLTELWSKKHKNASKGSTVNDDSMAVDPTPSGSTKRKESGSVVQIEAVRKSKKRRVVDSDEEEVGDQAATTGASDASKLEPISSQPSSSRASGYGSSSPPPKKSSDVQVSKKLAISGDGTSENVPESDDEGESEVEPDEDEDETSPAKDSKSLSKIGEAALARIKDVDIEGGWQTGSSIPYAALAKTFSLIEATTKRLEKNAILTAFLFLVIKRSDKGISDPLLQTVYLCINRLSPDYVGIELGIGESLLIKAIANSTGRKPDKVKSDLKQAGDLGLVAMNSKSSQRTLFKPKSLAVDAVFKSLKTIALTSGDKMQEKKINMIGQLLSACQGYEAKYIIRSLEGKLRIGNAERSVLVSLAQAAVLSESEKAEKKWSREKLASRLEEGVEIMKSTYSELPSYDSVVPALLQHSIGGIKEHCKLTPGVPLKPMLAKPTKAIGEVLDRFENKRFTCEYKYDGERAQVHMLEDGSIRVFSRNSEDMSKKYPDLVEQLPHCFKDAVKSFVFDSEAVAIDRSTGKLLPFQELSRRKRKDVKVEDIEVRVCLFAFDLLYLNGEPLLHKPLTERRQLLKEHFQVVAGEFDFAKSSDSEATEDIQSFLEESVKDGCEGLMVKMLESEASHYEPSRRSVNWLKLKKDYLAGVGDSLDLVVVGAYYGKGKRTNVYGAYLLACYDEDAEEFQTICKLGTGFSDEVLQSHYEALKPLEITTPRGDLKVGGAKPDIWFEPQVVWEVLAADLSLSPIYTAAQGLVDDRGISLRFPRFLRVRDDKDATDGTGPDQIVEMYERQALAQKAGKGSKKDDGFW